MKIVYCDSKGPVIKEAQLIGFTLALASAFSNLLLPRFFALRICTLESDRSTLQNNFKWIKRLLVRHPLWFAGFRARNLSLRLPTTNGNVKCAISTMRMMFPCHAQTSMMPHRNTGRPAARLPTWNETNAGRRSHGCRARSVSTECPVSHLLENVTSSSHIGSRGGFAR
jgi:hypothetical protein